MYFVIQRGSAADEVANPAAHALVNRIKEKLSKIQWALITQPGIELDQQIGSLAHPLAAIIQTILDAAMQKLPKRGYAHHAGDVTVLDRFGQMFAAQFRQIRYLRATA